MTDQELYQAAADALDDIINMPSFAPQKGCDAEARTQFSPANARTTHTSMRAQDR